MRVLSEEHKAKLRAARERYRDEIAVRRAAGEVIVRQRNKFNDPIDPELQKQVDARQKPTLDFVRKEFPSREDLMLKAFAGECTLRQAIKANCLDCSSYLTKEVTNCRAYACPMWRFRPFQNSEESEEEPCPSNS